MQPPQILLSLPTDRPALRWGVSICVTGRPEGVGAGLDGASEVVMKPFSEEQVAAASHVRPSGMLPAMIGFDSRILF